jgi:uncharacterized membrane protein
MKSENLITKYPRWVYYLLLSVTMLGLCFRLANLDGKVYWHDETFTALYVTGHSNREAANTLFSGQVITAQAVLEFQTLSPGRGLVATTQQLAANDPQHPPLYYLLARLMMAVNSDPVVATRWVAAIAGILLIPAVYWLSWELFKIPIVASLSSALVAVSPFHYLYAQEAREYSLWALTIVLASTMLARALRQNSFLSWIAYVAALTASLYTFVLTFMVVASHCLYIVWLMATGYRQPGEQKQNFSVLRNFILSLVTSLMLFSPWLRILREVNAVSWTAEPMPWPALLRSWVGHIKSLFFDVNSDSLTSAIYFELPMALLCLLLVGWSIYWAVRSMPRPVLLYLGLLGGITLLAFVMPDLLVGGRRSTVSRYLIPSWISLQILVAYGLGQKLLLSKRLGKTFWQAVLGVVIFAGILSCGLSVQADSWANKHPNNFNPQIAELINQQPPETLLVISDHETNFGNIISLSHSLDPDQKILGFEEPTPPPIPQNFRSMLLFNLSKTAREQIAAETGYSVTPLYQPAKLWKLETSGHP